LFWSAKLIRKLSRGKIWVRVSLDVLGGAAVDLAGVVLGSGVS
jgi:hypothetical protein